MYCNCWVNGSRLGLTCWPSDCWTINNKKYSHCELSAINLSNSRHTAYPWVVTLVWRILSSAQQSFTQIWRFVTPEKFTFPIIIQVLLSTNLWPLSSLFPSLTLWEINFPVQSLPPLCPAGQSGRGNWLDLGGPLIITVWTIHQTSDLQPTAGIKYPIKGRRRVVNSNSSNSFVSQSEIFFSTFLQLLIMQRI